MAVEETPNLYELRGEDTQVTYSTSSITGDPQLSYAGPKGEHSFSGDDIRTEDPALGREVSVILSSIADGPTTILTVLVPSIRLGEGAEAFETVAIVTTRLSSIAGPPVGSSDRYEVVPLSGDASFVQF